MRHSCGQCRPWCARSPGRSRSRCRSHREAGRCIHSARRSASPPFPVPAAATPIPASTRRTRTCSSRITSTRSRGSRCSSRSLPGLHNMVQMKEGDSMTIAIRSSLLIDGTGVEPVHNAVVLVEGDRITAVGREADLGIPDGAEVIDLGNETIMPGLVDPHQHITINPRKRGLLGQLEGLGEPDALQGARAAHNLRLDFKSGITTQRVIAEVHWNDIALKKAIADGWVPGPRLLCTTRGITSSNGHGAPSWMFDGPDEIRKAVRENLQHGADFIKILVLDRTPTSASYSAEEIQIAVDEAHRAGKPITAHASARPDTSLRLCLAAGVDSVEHAIPQNDEQIELYLQSGAAFVRTYTIGFQTQTDWAWFAGKSIEDRVKTMRKIVDDTIEHMPEGSSFADYYKTGLSLRDRVLHTLE